MFNMEIVAVLHWSKVLRTLCHFLMTNVFTKTVKGVFSAVSRSMFSSDQGVHERNVVPLYSDLYL